MACIQNRVIRDVVAVDETVSCAEAARVMAELGIGCVGVRRGGELVGVVTGRDLLRTLTAGSDAGRAPVDSALRPDVPAVSATATDAECARLMQRHRTGHLAVQERGDIIGVISLLDLSDLVVEEREWNIKLLQSRLRAGRGQELSPPIATIFSRPPPAGFMGLAD